jgi:hypothetical protein
MLIDNRLAIVILGILLSGEVNLSLISAQAFLLSNTQPLYTIYIALVANLVFSAFLNKFNLRKLKFAYFSGACILVYGLFTFFLTFHFFTQFVQALLWLLLATLGNRFFLWMIGELAIKHLDPARAQSSFSYLTMSDEIGTILAVIFLKTVGAMLNPDQTLYGASILFMAAWGFIALQFFSKRNLEIHFTKKTIDPPHIEKSLFRTFLVTFILLSVGLGLFKLTEDYLIKVVLKENLGSFESIRNMTANYMIIASVLTISISIAVGRFIEQMRLSPIRLMYFQTFSLGLMATLCFFFPFFYLLLGFEVIRRVVQNCFYSPANQMILSSFIGEFRNRLRSLYNLYYYTAVGIVLSLVFSYTQSFTYPQQLKLLLGMIIVSLAFALAMIPKLGRSFSKTMYAFIHSGHKTASIIAVNVLSFLKPKGYGDEMNKLLSLSPKKLLRKTIIVSLGYERQNASLETVMNEFQSDKEEIQLAVLDALKVAHQYKATQFMVKIIMAQERSKSLRVRMNATRIVAGIYGRRAIPFLLNGLEDPDPRIVANTLETLSIYKDKALLPYFMKFSQSENYRVRANALMGLSCFRKTREQYRQTIKGALTGQDLPMISSVLYVIGQMKDSHFKKELESLKNSSLGKEAQIKASLSWAFMRLSDRKGFELMDELFSLPYQEGQPLPSLHFLSQLNREARFDLIQYLVRKHQNEPEILANVGNHLRNSIFDFHEEIEYLHLLSLTS